MKKLILITMTIALFASCSQKQNEETMKTFTKIEPTEISDNAIQLISKDWMLITAGKKDDFNMMTASWGSIGFIWNEPVVFIFVRPQRHTFNFTEKDDYFTITVFEEEYREILNFCGTKSGRDYDKVKETGLIPIETELGNIYYEQARLVIECKKLYADFLHEDLFSDDSIPTKWYPTKDYHKMYVGKIVNVWEKK